ncbi:MAG: RHS repeat-associated core domain-containing protein [Blastocatellales bacterium]
MYAYNQVTAPLATAPQKEYGYRGGKLLIVWDGTQAGDDQLKWLVTDHLSSTRMLVNRSGGLCGAIERLDYLTFGEELASPIGHRNANCSGYVGGNNPRHKFGAKERDTETGLDYFGARYFASAQGRFTSPDEPLIDQYRAHPQSWNLYAYVLSNPLRYIDPTGQWHTDAEGNVIGDYNGECIENGACWNEERQLWELPAEPLASFAEQIIEFRDPFLEKVFINELVKEVSRDIKPGIIDVIPVVGGIKKLENAAKIVGRFGVVGGSRYRKAIKTLQRAGTHKELNGIVPTREEAEKMIIEAGGKIKRIERAHKSGKGHDFDHINYEAASGEKATVRVESVSRQYYAPGEGEFKDKH